MGEIFHIKMILVHASEQYILCRVALVVLGINFTKTSGQRRPEGYNALRRRRKQRNELMTFIH